MKMPYAHLKFKLAIGKQLYTDMQNMKIFYIYIFTEICIYL